MSETIRLNVTGMTCMHCVGAVKKALQEVAGVEEVIEVSLEPGSATVRGTATAASLIEAVRAAGYSAST